MSEASALDGLLLPLIMAVITGILYHKQTDSHFFRHFDLKLVQTALSLSLGNTLNNGRVYSVIQ